MPGSKKTNSAESVERLLRGCGQELRQNSDALLETSLAAHRRAAVSAAVRAAMLQRSAGRKWSDTAHKLLTYARDLNISAQVALVCILLLTIALVSKQSRVSHLPITPSPQLQDYAPEEIDSEIADAYQGLRDEVTSALANADPEDASSLDDTSIFPQYYTLNFSAFDLQQEEGSDNESYDDYTT